jgi:hypothetical protein
MAYYDNDTFDAYDEEPDEVCVCADDPIKPIWCKACGAWTDDNERFIKLPAEWINQPEIPALPIINTPVYQFDSNKEDAA